MSKQTDELIFLAPVKKQTIWGGNTLAAEYGFGAPGEEIAEAWVISAHPNGDCAVRGGRFDGCTLSELWEKQPQLFGRHCGDVFPLLVKLIDAKSDLSIQVHPDDAYAAAHENGAKGKSECWYILDCEPGASLVLGHNAATRQQAEQMIADAQWSELLRTVPVHKGDFFRIDPGTVHAIGGGIRLLETQQNSDITYRLYDYGRMQNGKPRALHIPQSLAVMTIPAVQAQNNFTVRHTGDATLTLLEECNRFSVEKLELDGSCTLAQLGDFLAVTVLEGFSDVMAGTAAYMVKKGDSFLVSGEVKELSFSGKLTAIYSWPKWQTD